MKKTMLILLFVIFVISFAFAQEQITITTYYPSPFGSYRNLTANQMKIGSTYSGAGTPFVNDGLIVQGNVGIGTNNPGQRLRVSGGDAVFDNNVGIGTAAPGARLEVVGDARLGRFIDRDNTSYYVDPNSGTSAVLAGSISGGSLTVTGTVSGNNVNASGGGMGIFSGGNLVLTGGDIWGVDALSAGGICNFGQTQINGNLLVTSTINHTSGDLWLVPGGGGRVKANNAFECANGYFSYIDAASVSASVKAAVVNTKNYGTRKLFTIEGPGIWFEDFGSGNLVNGKAKIKIDPIFLETINTSLNYHVFITPNGDCKGLYIAKKNKDSFEVKELNGGTSEIYFDYRIAAKRLGYENTRLPQTKKIEEIKPKL